MKITKQELKQLIKEEVDFLLNEVEARLGGGESVVPGLHYLETSKPRIGQTKTQKVEVPPPPIDLSQPMPAQVNLPTQEYESEDIGVWEGLPDWAKTAIMVGGAGALQYGMSKIPSRKPRWEEQPQMPHTRHGMSKYQVGQLEGDALKNHLFQQSQSRIPDMLKEPGRQQRRTTRLEGDLFKDFMDKYYAAGFKE